MPNFEVTAKCFCQNSDLIRIGDFVTLEISLVLSNTSSFIHSPLYPYPKHTRYYFLLRRTIDKELLLITYSNVQHLGKHTDVKTIVLPAFEKKGNVELDLQVVCDGYIGFDQTLKGISFIVEDKLECELELLPEDKGLVEKKSKMEEAVGEMVKD